MAMEIVDIPIRHVIFHSDVKLQESNQKKMTKSIQRQKKMVRKLRKPFFFEFSWVQNLDMSPTAGEAPG